MRRILNRPKLVSAYCLVGLFVLVTTPVAFGQDNLIAHNSPAADQEGLLPSSFDTAVDRPLESVRYRSSCGPRWTASADFIILDRIGSFNQTLVERVPLKDDPFKTTGTEALNSNDLQQGFAAGPKLDLIRHGDSGYDLELSYFQIDGWSSDRSIGPDTPTDWLVMRSPGFVQTNQQTDQAMVWDYATKLYNAELNVRWNPSSRVTMLAGFRWINLGETLVGTLNPIPSELSDWHFWNTTTTNNLYGLQIGADGKLFERGRFSIDGLVKAGIFDNNAEQTTEISVIFKKQRWASASANAAAFAGETGLQCKYQVTKGLLLRAGYEVIWLQGVALAPGQIQETSTDMRTITTQVLGVNCNSGVLYHGATAGLEYSF
jgi:hypothetical protein